MSGKTPLLMLLSASFHCSGCLPAARTWFFNSLVRWEMPCSCKVTKLDSLSWLLVSVGMDVDRREGRNHVPTFTFKEPFVVDTTSSWAVYVSRLDVCAVYSLRNLLRLAHFIAHPCTSFKVGRVNRNARLQHII